MPENINLELDKKPITVSVDGHGIKIRKDGLADVIFFQVLSEGEQSIKGQGVASLRFTLAQLEALSKSINDSIKEHKSSENVKTQK